MEDVLIQKLENSEMNQHEVGNMWFGYPEKSKKSYYDLNKVENNNSRKKYYRRQCLTSHALHPNFGMSNYSMILRNSRDFSRFHHVCIAETSRTALTE